MNKINKSLIKILTMMLICLILSTGCQQQSSNPDSQKVKEIQDEIIDLKVRTDKISEDFATIKQDLEVIKQHLVPSYSAKIEEDTATTDVEVTTSSGGNNTTVDVVVDDKKTGTTLKTEVTDNKSTNVQTTSRPNPVVTVPVEPKTAQTKSLPGEPSKPASNKLDEKSDGTHPPLKTKSGEIKDHQLPKGQPGTRIIPQPQIPEPKTPEPKSPATKSDARNINYTFSDIMDHPYRQYIGVLATIGNILDKQSGTFEPEEIITKAEFLTWLFKTYNAYHNKNIPIASSSASVNDIFDDVPPSHVAYPYIQGLANAGLLVTFNEERILHPDDPLTREELIAYIEYMIRGEPEYQLAQITPEFCKLYIKTFVEDGKDIDLDYTQMIYRNLNESTFIDKTFRIFQKNIVILIPKKAVTRAQAAASLCFIDGMSPTQLGFYLKDNYEADKKKLS
ncbi:MAG: S-layer homology domain-containing protein [Cyanobacteriota bacterium]